MAVHQHGANEPVFRITAYPGGFVDIAVCWQAIDVPGVAEALHQIADGLAEVPPGTRADGVMPL